MRRLLAVELTRLRLRRAVVMLLIAAIVVPALIFAGLAWGTRPYSDAERQEAEQRAAAEAGRLDEDRLAQREIRRCLERPRDFGIRPADAEAKCRELFAVPVEAFLSRPPLRVAQERTGTGIAVISVLAALAMLVGTTFAGHDWNSGSMSNQLLFEPRRLRVYAAKAAAVLIVGLVAAAAVLATYWLGLWLLTQTRDLAVADEVWRRVVGTAWRGAALAGLAGLLGYALTMLFRSTVATLSIMAGVAIAGSLVTIAVLGEDGQRWLVPVNALAVLVKGYNLRIFDEESCNRTRGRVCERIVEVSQWDGALFLGVILLAAVLLSLWTFRRRDVP